MNKLERLVINSLNHAVKDFDQSSIIAKVPKVMEKMLICAPSGMAPHKIQYTLAREVGMKPETQTVYSAGLGLVIGSARYLLGSTLENLEILNLPKQIANNLGIENTGTILKYWAVYSFTDASIRLLYAGIFKRPLGTFLWESGYLIKQKTFDKLKTKQK